MVMSVLARLWKDRCTVSVWRPYKKPDRSTGHREEVVIEDEPCKLSFFASYRHANGATRNDDIAAKTIQVVKLFISSDVDIPAGSKIAVTHQGKTTSFTHSGAPAVFTNHQEITLELFDKWA